MKSIISALIVLLMWGTLASCTTAAPVDIETQEEGNAIEVDDFTIPNSGEEGSISWSKPEVMENLEATPAIDDNSNVYVAGGDTMVSYDTAGVKS